MHAPRQHFLSSTGFTNQQHGDFRVCTMINHFYGTGKRWRFPQRVRSLLRIAQSLLQICNSHLKLIQLVNQWCGTEMLTEFLVIRPLLRQLADNYATVIALSAATHLTVLHFLAYKVAGISTGISQQYPACRFFKLPQGGAANFHFPRINPLELSVKIIIFRVPAQLMWDHFHHTAQMMQLRAEQEKLVPARIRL